MKKILALAAVAALTAGVSAYAANPFSDVSTDDWAYQAVSDLSDQGVVEGYPDGTFKGERNMTRYELAQIIARLMAKEDQLNAEQQATLDKLAGEYADELANLGVRVSNLEKKVGNLYWSGDARMRYQSKDNTWIDATHKTGATTIDTKEKKASDSWNGRMRINAKAQVNESTYVNGKLTYDMDFKGDDSAKKVYMQQLFVNHNFGEDVAVRLGRQPIVFGNQGGWLYGDANGYDGAQIAYNNGKLALTTGFGQLNASDIADVKSQDMYFAKGAYDFGFAKLGADYVKFQQDAGTNDIAGQEYYGVNLNIPVQKFNVFGEYWKNTVAKDYDTAWNAGLSYGKADWKKPGTWDLSVAYNDVDKGVYFGGSGLSTDALATLKDRTTSFTKDGEKIVADDTDSASNVTFWNAIANVTLQKNVQLHAEYAFDVDTENSKRDAKDAWTVSLNYMF